MSESSKPNIVERLLYARDRYLDDPVQLLRVIQEMESEVRAIALDTVKGRWVLANISGNCRPCVIAGHLMWKLVTVKVASVDGSRFLDRHQSFLLTDLLPNGLEDLLEPDDPMIPLWARVDPETGAAPDLTSEESSLGLLALESI